MTAPCSLGLPGRLSQPTIGPSASAPASAAVTHVCLRMVLLLVPAPCEAHALTARLQKANGVPRRHLGMRNVTQLRRRGFIIFFGTRSVVSNDPTPPVQTRCPRCGQLVSFAGKSYRNWFT